MCKNGICRKQADGGYNGTTWQIKFQLDEKMKNFTGNFKLRIALATSNVAELQVSFEVDFFHYRSQNIHLIFGLTSLFFSL